MGNCFAGCFQGKESLSAASSDENLSETSSSESAGGLSTYKKTKNGEAARTKKDGKKKESLVVTRKAWTRNRNRVAPCSNGTASGTRRVKTFQGRKHFPLSVSSSSGSLDSSITPSSSDSFETESDVSYGSESYEESSSRSSYSETGVSSTTYDNSSSQSESSQSMEIKPGVTQGRLIIVQPCRSLSESQESSSTESIHSEYTVRTADSASDSSSSSSCSRDKGYSDNSSDEEFCKVHPY